MAAIPNFGSAETGALSTSSTGTWSDVVSYVFPDTSQVASSTYVVFWNTAISGAAATSDVQVQVLEDATVRASANIEPKEVTTPVDRDQESGFFFFTAASTPAATIFKIQIKSEAVANSTAHNGYIRVVKLPANSVWAESTSDEAFTSLADKTGASVSVTNGAEYLFLASAEVDANTTGATVYINDGSNDYPLGATNSDAANYAGMIMALKGTAGAFPVKVRVVGNGGGTVNVRNVRLLALKVSDFNNIHFARMSADGSGVGTTYTTQLTNTQTVAAGDHLVIASMVVNPNSATVSGYGRLTSGGSQVDEVIREGASTGAYGTIMRLETYTAGSKTWTLDAKSESGALTFLRQGSSISVIDLQEPLGGTTGWKSPGSTANRTYTGTTAWSNTANIVSDNVSYSQAENISTSSQLLEASNFGFTTSDLPSGSTITGIEVQVKVRQVGSAAIDNFAKLINGTAGTAGDEVGSDKSLKATLPTTDTYQSYGGAADAWSASLSSAVLRSSAFGFRYQAASSNPADDVIVDHIRVRATWAAHTGGYSAEFNVTEANDTLATTGGPKIVGTSAMTEADDTVASAGQAGTNIRSGELSATEGGDTIAATALLGPILNALSLSNSSVVENSTDGTFIGNIIGKTAGSTLTLTYTAGGRVKLGGSGESRTITVGGASNYDVTPTHNVTIKESLAGYPDRETTLPITITNNAGYSPSPWLYDSSVSETDFDFIHGTDPSGFNAVSYIGRAYHEMTGIGTGIAISSGGTYAIKQRESNPSFVEGDTITGATSGATATVNTVSPSTGSWAGGDMAANLTLTSVVGTFVVGENLNVGVNLDVATVSTLNLTDLNIKQSVYVFTATFTDTSHTIDFHMDERYGSQAAAQVAVDKYTGPLGRLPKVIRENFLTVKGLMGDGTFNAESSAHFFTIYETRADTRIANSDLEESFFHECIHASLQSEALGIGLPLYGSADWNTAVAADAKYITKYAASSGQEDFAESALFAYTLHEHPERFPEPDRTQIAAFTPNRHLFWNKVFFPNVLEVTEEGDTLVATGAASGNLVAVTEASDTLVSTGTVALKATAGLTEADDLASTGTPGSLKIQGTGAVTEASDTLVATGAFGAVTAITEADDTIASTGIVALRAVASIVEADDSSAGAGSLSKTAALAITEQSDTLASTALARILGVLARTEANDTIAATGEGVLLQSGALSVTEANDTVASTGTVRISAAAGLVEANDNLSATGYREGEFSDLIVDNLIVSENANIGDVVGEIFNRLPGSNLELTDDAGELFALDGTSILVAGELDFETSDFHQITVTESGVSGYPDKDNIFTITVTDAEEGFALVLSLVEASDTLTASATLTTVTETSGVWTIVPRPAAPWSLVA